MQSLTNPSSLRSRARRGRPIRVAGILSLVILVAGPALADAVLVQNGEVVIGSPAEGPDLIRSRVPERPLLVAIDTPYEIFNEAGTLIHVAAWTADGRPAREASVYLSDHLVGRTDEHGTLVFRWGVQDSGAGYWRRGGDIAVRWDDAGTLYGGDVEFHANPRTGSFASDHVFVYTDRGVYNPGDRIRIRALGWHLAADYSPIVGEEIEFLLTDPSGRVVAGGRGETDSFGVTALDLPLSEQSEEGVYELSATYEEATSNARLRIKRFTPPVIRIDHTLGRFLTRDQSELRFEVTLGYFTEAVFEGGTVAIDVEFEDASRYRSEIEVDGPGPHEFLIDEAALDAIRRGLAEDDRVEVTLTVTDVYGRQDELIRELRYVRNPYIAIIEKDRDAYSPGDPVELIIRLTDLERVPVRSTEVTLLTSTGLSLTSQTDEGGTVQFSLTMPEAAFRVEVLLADVETAVATGQIPLHGAQPMRSHIGDAIVRENEPAHVSVTFPSTFIPAESVVHMDVVDTSGALVQAVLIPIRTDADGHVAEASFATPSWGSMLLTFFCLGRDLSVSGSVREGHTALGLMTEGQNLAVHPGRELRIQLDGIPDEVSPGAEYAGQIRVLDSEGNPVDASVGAAVVDMAVISLKSPLEITPMDYFYNPELRVISTTGSAILTWPVVSRNWGGRRRDVALPPFPYLAGGRVDGIFNGERKVEFALGDAAEVDPDQAMLALGPGGMDAYSLVGDYFDEPAEAEMAEAAPVITIRTEFPDTSLWEPFIEAREGRAELRGRMPDAITTQEIALVASDRRGGVGVLRVPVRVSQPLFVQAELPDRLTVGDELDARVVVQNYTDETETVELSLVSERLEVDGGRRTVQVGPNGTAVASFPVRAVRPGPHDVVVSARTDRRQDIEERTIWVLPLGPPQVAIQGQRLIGGAPAELTVEVPDDGQMTTVTLNVAFPAVSAAYAGLDAIRAELSAADTLSLGGEILATTLLYEHQKAGSADPSRLVVMRAALEQGLVDLLSVQRPDGGWGFWWDWESNPYVTAYCLEVLTALDRAGLGAPTPAFRNAVNYLAAGASEGLYDMSAIAFWEGNTETVRLGLTAEIFAILADVPSRARTPEWRRAVETLAAGYEAYLDTDTPDVLAYAHAVLGLFRADQASVHEIEASRLVRAAERLNRIRRDAHWEPSWFNAYGGTIEATVTALQVFHELGHGDVLEAEQRQAVQYLLSTRDEWGGWHNPRGTAAAIRGLLVLEPAGEERPATVVVTVDGREVSRVPIDPADPFLSSTELRALDLTPHLSAGRAHTVAVGYDGTLEPDVSLIRRHWPDPAEVEGRIVRLEAGVSETTADVDGVIRYTLEVTSWSGEDQLVRVDVAAPANAEIDLRSVESLRERGLIDGAEATDTGYRLTLQLEGRARRQLELLLVARRPGRAVVPAAVATVLGSSTDLTEGLAVAMLDEPLVVREQ